MFELSSSNDVQAENQGGCAQPGVRVVYDDPAELEMVCGTLADIVDYFRDISFEIAPFVLVSFENRPTDRRSDQVPVHGFFDAPRSRIVVYRSSDARPWGLEWSSGLARSFLHHELAHLAVWEITDASDIRFRPEWQEFFAYAVQFDLMSPDLREEILAMHTDVPPFDDLIQVNEFTSRMNPELFAVAVYETYLSRSGAQFLEEILRAEVELPQFVYPFPVLPGQVPAQ